MCLSIAFKIIIGNRHAASAHFFLIPFSSDASVFALKEDESERNVDPFFLGRIF